MNEVSLHPNPQAVKTGRFVAPTPDAQADLERQIGRNLYRRGKPLRECVTDEMAAGYLAEERRCEDAYWRCMMAEAVA